MSVVQQVKCHARKWTLSNYLDTYMHFVLIISLDFFLFHACMMSPEECYYQMAKRKWKRVVQGTHNIPLYLFLPFC